MGKQSSFTHQNAYDVLRTISSASHRNTTLEVDLRRTRKNVSVLASRLQEARFIIGILEDALLSLLPPVPVLPAPPLPPRPDVVMEPPALQVVPDPIPDLAGPLPPADPTLPTDPPSPPDHPVGPPLGSSDPGTPVPLILTPSPRPPQARTPPELPSPDRTGFHLSEWNFPSTTYRSLTNVPLAPDPPPPTPAAQQPPPDIFSPAASQPPAVNPDPVSPTATAYAPPAASQPPADIFPPAASQPPAIDPSPVSPTATACAPPAASQPPAGDPIVTQLQDLAAEMSSLRESRLPPHPTAEDPHLVFFALCTRMRILFATVPTAPPSVHDVLLALINEISDMVESVGGLLPLPPPAVDVAIAVAAPPVPRSDPDPLPTDQGGASLLKKRRSRRK